MTSSIEPRGKNIGPFVLGGTLVIVGLLFMFAQFFQYDFSTIGELWPYFVLAPGLVIFGFAVARGGSGEPLASVGSIVTMLGVLLLYQNSTGHWENWAYTWALLVPTAIGLGKMIFGTLTGQRAAARDGLRLTIIGGVIFLVGFFFFEVVLGIGGLGLQRFGLTRFAWPIMMIGVGVTVIVYSLLAKRHSSLAEDSSK
jgi:hypothetical protein